MTEGGHNLTKVMQLVSRTRILIPGRALVAVLLALAWLAFPAAPIARADDPVTLSRDGQITDKVGALGDRRSEVVAALDRLYADRRIQLFVVYVRDFSGRSAQNWADETARKNGLGLEDVLLAVATHDRQYAYTVDQGSRLTDAQLRDVASTAIEPALRENDWAGAAIGAADGYTAVLAGKAVPTPAVTPGANDPGTGNPGGTGAWDLLLPVALVGGAGAVAAYTYTRRKRRTTTRTTPGATGWAQGTPPPELPTPLRELDARAKQTLVDTDDAVRTSEEETRFAPRQFGEEAAPPPAPRPRARSPPRRAPAPLTFFTPAPPPRPPHPAGRVPKRAPPVPPPSPLLTADAPPTPLAVAKNAKY
ncbi:hypothetical protein GCM10018966_012510 [Streptomyces yanii]